MGSRKGAPQLVAYTCGVCGKPAEAPADSALVMLQICAEPCQAKRREAGLKAQREAARG